MKNLYYLTTQLEFKKFKTVYKQNDSPGDVYIIKSGEFKVVKSIDHEEKLLVNNDHILMSRNANKKTNKLEICLLGPGEAFGEEEVVQKINRLHTVVCNSITGSVFVIDHKEFLKRVYLSQTAKKQLKEQIISKNEWREKRYDDNFTENQTILYSYPKNSDNKNNEKNGDPDEFAMIKSNTTRNKNFITNWKEVYSNPLNILARKPREKIKMNPVMENIVDPKTLIFSLNGKNFLKEMTANSPKRNFFILTNALRKEKTSKNQNNERKKRKKTPQKTTENTERKKEELSNRESDKKDDNPIKFNFKQILLPISNTSINNFLKMKKNNSDDEYQIFSNPILNSRKKTVKRIMLSQDNSHKGEKHFENLIIEGKISKDSPKSAFGEKSRSVDLNNEYMRLLPLKYSSEHIKRNHKLCFLTSSSPLMRKISRNEFFSEDECLTSRHY